MPAVNISRNFLLVISLIYIYLPISIFFVGWTRPCIAMTCLSILFICAVRCLRQAKRDNELANKKTVGNIRIGLGTLEFVLFLFIFIGYYAGFGRFVDQSFDWLKHNAILADLVNKSWPVYYSNKDEYSMLTYYIAQYIVPSAIGKLFNSFRCAEIALYVWNVIGLFLVFLHMVSFLSVKKTIEQLVCAAAIPFFDLPVWLSKVVLRQFIGYGSVNSAAEWYYSDGLDGVRIHYFDNFFQLRWAFPQAITIWLIMMILLEYREYIRYYVLVILPGMLFATLSFIGILPLALGFVVEKVIKAKGKGIFFQIFSFENVTVTVSCGIVLLLYLYGNVTGEKPEQIGFHLMPYTIRSAMVYLVFVCINVTVYALILFKSHKNDGIYYAVVSTLMILPFFSMGMWNDLEIRSSIPSLFVLMIYILAFLNEQMKGGSDNFLDSKKVAICLIFLVIGAYYPFSQLSSCIASKDYQVELGNGNGWSSMEPFANRKLDISNDVKFNYYSYELDKNIFYKYLASNK